MKRKKTLLRIFLVPIIGIVLVQGLLPFTMLFFNGIKPKLEDNAVSMAERTIENRQVVMQSAMVEQWSSISEEAAVLEEKLNDFLRAKEMNIDEFIRSDAPQREYLEQVFSDMLMSLQFSNTSGMFLILTNDSYVKEEASYRGFFIRDSSPQAKTDTNSDLLLERGNKELARVKSISMDNAWATDFKFEGQGVRSADDFFYEPYIAAVNNPETDMVNLGYWSEPFILENHYMDGHEMITYSLPLMYEGRVYGIAGVEISLDYIKEYFTVQDLDQNQNAGYALMLKMGEQEYLSIVGKGSLYSAATHKGLRLELEEQDKAGLYKVKDVDLGGQGIYVMLSNMKLYSNNVPYENTQWVLAGFVTEKSIYGLGEKMYRDIAVSVAFCMAASILVVTVLIRYVVNPVYRLMASIRGGAESIHTFKMSNISEIDELHDVIENLSDVQKQSEEQIREEKERYRVAVESSKDIFLTYNFKTEILEIINSDGYDGKWNCAAHLEFKNNMLVHPNERQMLINLREHEGGNINIDYRHHKPNDNRYIWMNLSGTIITEENGDQRKLVGCIRDIDQRKRLEIAQKTKERKDPVTSFYKMNAGIEEINKGRKDGQKGIFFLLDIIRFGYINQQFGRTLGDILLEQLSADILEECYRENITDGVFIRAGGDELAGWLPEAEKDTVCRILERVREHFVKILNNNVVELDFQYGIVCVSEKDGADILLTQAKAALVYVKTQGEHCAVYQELSDKQKAYGRNMSFGEITVSNSAEKLGLIALVLNLFEKNGYTPAILDILSLKLKEIYDLGNLVITAYNRERATYTIDYRWKKDSSSEDGSIIVHCDEEKVSEFVRKTGTAALVQVTEEMCREKVISDLVDYENTWLFNMTDNGYYSGSIFFVGVKEATDEALNMKKDIREVGTLIQNRINQERHDLSVRAKADFLAKMSHEIRTPMNGIMGMTELALKSDQTAEKRVDCLNKIRDTSEYMMRLLNDVLDMSKIESGKMKLVMDDFNLDTMIQTLKTLLEIKFKKKQISYEENIKIVNTWFSGDEIRIKQVLVNLVDNAVKYSDAGGKVRLSVIETPVDEKYSDVFFEVKDNGHGISEEDQQRVFESFERVLSAENRESRGTGLGLAISNSFIRMMGSKIELESKLGEGSAFSFNLRFKRVAPKQSNEMVAEEKSLEGYHVLVAEDNALNQEIIYEILKDMGLAVEIAGDGKEVVEKFRMSDSKYYDIILMDIMMPEMDGLEATESIRKMDRADSRTVPIVAMSANAFAEDRKRSLESGMNEHMAKPIDVKKLRTVLQKYLK